MKPLNKTKTPPTQYFRFPLNGGGLRGSFGFTLVELIVVISILAILGTIAFLSFGGFSSKARDGTRISDVTSITKGLELFSINAGKYPAPEGNVLSGTINGQTLTYVGEFGDNASNMIKISKSPLDPKTNTKYVYGTTKDYKYYQIATTLENNLAYNKLVNQIYADTTLQAKVNGNYPGYIKFSSGTTETRIANIPGIIFNNTGSVDLLSVNTYFVANKSTNLPYKLNSTDVISNKNGNEIIQEITNSDQATLTGVNITNVTTQTGVQALFSGSLLQSFGGNITGIEKIILGTSSIAANTEQTGDTFTKLLIHSNEPYYSTGIIDSSPINNTVTAFNGAHHEAISPLGGSSINFDGTGDYISLADSEDWNFGTGDFTIDFWVNFDITRENAWIGSSQDSNNGFYMYFNTTQGVVFNAIIGLDTYLFPTSLKQGNITGWQSNKWYNVAITRSGNTWTIYRDGASIATATNTATFPNLTSSLMIGRAPGVADFKGSLDEMRISKGIARWTTNFTPPNSRYTADSYTKLLIHSNTTDGSTTFNDSEATPKAITRYGDTKHKITPAKFGNSSLSFDGVDDYLSMSDSEDWNFGTGDFTIDTWIYPTNADSDRVIVGQAADSSNRWYFEVSNVNALQFYSTTGISFSAQNSITLNTWNHVALVRSGNTFKGYVNGVEVATVTSSLAMPNLSAPLNIGKQGGTQTFYYNGFIDEFRISKGVAKRTSNFTPPTTSY